MEERDRVQFNVVVAGGAELAGVALGGGPEVSALAAMVPVLVQELTARRARNVVDVAESACDLRGFDPEDLRAWVQADERHAAYLQDVIEAAWATLDGHKLRTLSLVLADGMADDARLDVGQLVVRALRELEAGHVRVLQTIASRRPDRPQEGAIPARANPWSTGDVIMAHPNLEEGLDSILATLQRLGCITPGQGGGYGGPAPWVVLGFGARCLSVARAGGMAL